MQTAVAEPAAFAGMLDDQLATRLLYQRIIVLGTEVDDRVANRLCAQLLLLSAEDPRGDISLYINSPGGSVTARAGHLRHDAADPQRRPDAGHGPGRQHGPVPAVRRDRGQAVQPAARPGAHAPGLGRVRRHRRRRRDLRRAAGADGSHDDQADLEAHRPAGGDGGRATACGTAGSAPRRPATTGSSTTSWSGSTTCAPRSARRPGCDHEPVHDPHRGGEDRGRRAGLRHLLPAALGADHLPRHRDRRRRRQRGHGPAAAPRVGQPRPGDHALHQLPGRLLQRADRDLRHDELRPAGRRHRLHGAGGFRGGGAARGRARRAGDRSCSTPRCCCTSRRARPGAPCPTWPSRPRRWPGSGPRWTRSSAGTPATRWPRSGATPTGT